MDSAAESFLASSLTTLNGATRLEVAYRVAALAAPAVLPAKTRRLYRDTRRLFPERSRLWAARVARRQSAHRVWVALDKLALPRLSRDELVSAIEPESVELARSVFRAIAAEGRGVLVYSLHYGRPMVPTYLLPHLGFDCISLRAGVGVAPGGGSVDASAVAGLMTALRGLREGRTLFVLVDGRLARNAPTVDFFGCRVPMSFAFVRLAQMTGAALVAGATISTGPMRFRFDLERMEAPAPGELLEALAARLLAPLERTVRRDPGQWYGVNRVYRDVGSPRGAKAAGVGRV